MAADDGERLGFVTLAQFLRQLPPELSVLHDGGNGAERLRWVEPSELEDPTPYLLDGEFLLTAGLPFLGAGGRGELVDAYVQRLVAARVSALGFGLEPYFDAVPDTVVQACRRHNLTLVAVPKTVPFAAVGLEFSQLLESDNATTFRQLADTNRQLMRAVLSARPEHELLAALAQRIAGAEREQVLLLHREEVGAVDRGKRLAGAIEEVLDELLGLRRDLRGVG